MKNYYSLLVSLLLFNFSFAQNAIDYSYQLTAITQVSPPQIKVNWKKISGVTSYEVYRKTKTATSFGSPIATLGAADSFYLDNNVVVDSAYEYQVFGGANASGYMYAAIKAMPIHNRGAILLLIDSTFSDSCKYEIERLKKDIRGDGWKVLTKTFLRTETVANIKSYIVSTYNNDNSLKSIFIIGHIAVPYSGNLNPDAHPDHQGAWPADVFYADVDGIWTDNSVNTATNPTLPGRTQNVNTPGDGKYDQSVLPSDVDLQIGRVDFANMPSFTKTEIQLMRSYLDRAHLYKVDSLPIVRRALIDDNFGLGTGEPFAANGWRNFSPLLNNVNTQSIDYISSLNAGSYQWSYGCGGGSYTSASGIGTTANIAANNINGIFTMLFGSYFGDWDASNNFLRAPLCANIPALTNCWAGRPHWFFHHMALGEPIGYSTMATQNNSNQTPSALYLAKNNYGARMVHIALMGDPTLRTDYLKSPSNVTLASIQGAGAKVSWTASPDPAVSGYYVYRSATEFGTYQRRSGLVNTTTFTDSFGTNGLYYYMVRAVKLQNTPSGGYYNLSLGAISTPVSISYPFFNVGVPNTVERAIVQVYPNPAKNIINVSFNNSNNGTVAISVTDMLGRTLMHNDVTINDNNTLQVDVSRLTQGIYILSVSQNGKTESVKWEKL